MRGVQPGTYLRAPVRPIQLIQIATVDATGFYSIGPAMPSLAPLSGGSVLCAEPKSGGQAVPVATIGDFELISLAGRGTFAEVWQVRDRRTGRRRALKRLRADRQDPKSARQILENEAEIGRRIASPHLVACCESHLDEELPYLVLEWLSGRTLEARLAADRHLFCHEALWIARQCAQIGRASCRERV